MQSGWPRKLMSAITAALWTLLMSTFMADGQQSTPAEPADARSSTEFAIRGQRDARAIKFDDWQKFCFKTPGSKMVCRTTISGKWDTGQSAVRIDLIEREGESAARLQLFLPVGLFIQAGANLTVDQHERFQIPFRWCLTNTCIAGDKADPLLMQQMEAGQNLTLEVMDTNLLSVSTVLPLGAFASVRKGSPNRTFAQDIDE